MTEIDVAVTDYLLSLASAWFASRLYRLRPGGPLGRYFVLTFAALSVAALLGGTSHGFFNIPGTPVHALLWWLTLLAVGAAATGLLLGGLALLQPNQKPDQKEAQWRHAQTVAVLLFGGYALLTFFRPLYLFAILFYLPALLVCLAGFVVWGRRHVQRGAAYGIAGILLSLLAALGQQLGVSLPALQLSHNAVYHLVMLPALWQLYRGMAGVMLAKP